MNELDKSKHGGNFKISPEREVPGNLSLDGPHSSLHVWDGEPIDIEKFAKSTENTFTGILENSKIISLIDCIVHGSGFHRSQDGKMYYLDISPHYIVLGDQDISDTNETIIESYFVIDDAPTLFYDNEAFGSVIDSRSIMKQIVETEKSHHDIRMEDYPEVAFYTGKTEVFSSDTVLGRVSARHNPTFNMGGPDGVKMDNKISICMEFEKSITFREVVDRNWKVLRFLELMVGRPPNLLEFKILPETKQEIPEYLDVYGCMFPKYKRTETLHFADVLIDAVRDSKGFSRILAAWLERDDTWRDARNRFSNSVKEENTYGIDRLIRDANMFDLLPETVFTTPEALSKNVIDATEKAKQMFQSLPRSPERDTVLGALGRVGKWTLKGKIRHRSQLLLSRIEERLPELSVVTDEAVNCRNHYVHGSDSRIDYNEEFGIRSFLTDTLEFIFAASDLVEAGWDIESWCQKGPHWHHPIGRYLYYYSENLEGLKSLISAP